MSILVQIVKTLSKLVYFVIGHPAQFQRLVVELGACVTELRRARLPTSEGGKLITFSEYIDLIRRVEDALTTLLEILGYRLEDMENDG